MGETAKHTDEGQQKIYVTSRPYGTITYFSSAGDDAVNGIGEGNKLLFSLTAIDTSKTVDLQFNEDVWIKDGFIMCINAPFGASIDIEVVHPTNGVIARFGKKIFIYGTYNYQLDTDDRAKILQGNILRVTVNNSSGTGGEDIPGIFKVLGRVEFFRATTV